MHASESCKCLLLIGPPAELVCNSTSWQNINQPAYKVPVSSSPIQTALAIFPARKKMADVKKEPRKRKPSTHPPYLVGHCSSCL